MASLSPTAPVKSALRTLDILELVAQQTRPLTAQEIRSAVFSRAKGGRAYAEGPVDAFLERAVDVLLAAE